MYRLPIALLIVLLLVALACNAPSRTAPTPTPSADSTALSPVAPTPTRDTPTAAPSPTLTLTSTTTTQAGPTPSRVPPTRTSVPPTRPAATRTPILPTDAPSIPTLPRTLLPNIPPGALIWNVSADFGVASQYSGSLASSGLPILQPILIQVSGLVPGSPNSSTRAVRLDLACTGTGVEHVGWTWTRASYVNAERFACGQSGGSSLYVTYNDPYILVTLFAPADQTIAVDYTFTIEFHTPY